MLRLRSLTSTTLVAALTTTVARRFLKPTDPTYEDDRWLEAEFQDVEKTIEERYAHEKQKELMKRLIQKLRDENDAKLAQNVKAAEERRAAEVAQLQQSIDALHKKLEEVQTK